MRALVGRTREAAEQTGLERIAVVGGVAANSALRAALPDARFAPLELCTDNAAMIASAARYAERLPVPRLSRARRLCLGLVGQSRSRRLLPRSLAAVLGGLAARRRAGADRVHRRGGLAGRARRSRGRVDRAALHRRPARAVAGHARARRRAARQPRRRCGGWAASARAAQEQFLRADRRERRGDHRGAPVRPRAERGRRLGSTRPRSSCSSAIARSSPCTPFAWRIRRPTDVSPGVPVAVPASVPGLGVPGLEGRGVVVALLDTGRRPVAPVPPRERHVGHRRDHAGQRRDRAAASDDPAPAGAPRHGACGGRGRLGRAGRAPRHRPGRVDPARFGSPAGSRTPRADTPSTRAPTRCSPGSRRRSTRTRTATRTTRPGSRSSGSPSRTRRSRTGRSPARSTGATALDTLVVVPGGERRAMPGRRSEASPGRAARRRRSRSEPWTAGRRRRPCACYVRASLRVLFDGVLPLGGRADGHGDGGRRRRSRARSAPGASAAFFDARRRELDRRARRARHARRPLRRGRRRGGLRRRARDPRRRPAARGRVRPRRADRRARSSAFRRSSRSSIRELESRRDPGDGRRSAPCTWLRTPAAGPSPRSRRAGSPSAGRRSRS